MEAGWHLLCANNNWCIDTLNKIIEIFKCQCPRRVRIYSKGAWPSWPNFLKCCILILTTSNNSILQKILPNFFFKIFKKGNFSAFNHALSISIDPLWPTFHQPISDRFWFYFAYDLSLLKSFASPLKFSSVDSKFGICFPIWGSHIAHKNIFSCLELCL